MFGTGVRVENAKTPPQAANRIKYRIEWALTMRRVSAKAPGGR